jgi:hypothetical protein
VTLTVSDVDSVEEIGHAMTDAVSKYYKDMLPYQYLSIMDFARKMREIPYCVELGFYQNLQRPGLTMNRQGPFTACANKAIATAAYLVTKGIAYRFKLVSDSENSPLHHVFVEAFLGSDWVPLDVTYPENKIGVSNQWAQEMVVYP